MGKNIGYHTRLYNDNTTKVFGGSFGGSLDLETANRLINHHHYDVVVKPSGTPVFVDREGREVRLYFCVDPDMTTKGLEAIKTWRKNRAREIEEEERLVDSRQKELDDAMEGLTHSEIIRRLKSPVNS